MPDERTIDDFMARPHDVPMIDVRTPVEFALGHIPGALNVPLFSDDERVEVGTAYKQHGRQHAVSLGLRFIGPRLEDLALRLLALTDRAAPRLHVHCWRGGMRSASVAWLMETMFGCQVATLKGGYKSFRRWVLSSFALPREVRVVAGLTGCGKTEILKQLADLGEVTVDLEHLARHKGSVFGQLGEGPQPTQAQFENELALAWRNTSPAHLVWIEDESRMIGKRVLPADLWQQKQQAHYHVIDLPDEPRVAHLCQTYAGFPSAELATRVESLRSRLGGDRTQAALAALDRGDAATACRLLLTYYDRSYQKSLAAYPPERVTHHSFPRLDARRIAASLIESTRPSP